MDKPEIPIFDHHVGSTERVFVAHVTDLNDFYLHSELVRERLGKLGQELYDEYSDSLLKPQQRNEILRVGDYCACPSESEDWYRGLIRQIDSNGHASVFKLDYGDVQCVPIQFLRPLRNRFFTLHRLAFHCSLVDLIRPIDGWPLDVIEEFRSRLTTTFLFAQFINYNEIRDISEVEITEKSSKIPLNKDFAQKQVSRSALQINDRLVYKYIPMEQLDAIQSYQVRILYYVSPSHFYIYLKEKFDAHKSYQSDLQQAVRGLRTISSPVKYQIVAAQDNHAIWHRAVITELNANLTRICVYFTDLGQCDFTSVHNIRSLPEDFQRKPAFAIPCRLHKISPVDTRELAAWSPNDSVHAEISRLVHNTVGCKICAKHDQIGYEVEIDIPKVGDLGVFLCEKKLVSRTRMHPGPRQGLTPSQSVQASFARNQLQRGGVRFSSPQQQRTGPRAQFGRGFTHPDSYTQSRSFDPTSGMVTVQQHPSQLGQTSASSRMASTEPMNGWYKITQVHSAMDFYGVPQIREQELLDFSKQLEEHYNFAVDDPASHVNRLLSNEVYVVQHDDKYHRVKAKNNDGGPRVPVKFLDRGDEILVDRSELLRATTQHASRAPFAQPFCLHGYGETRSSTSTTHTLKKLILNQQVQITLACGNTNGVYPVNVHLQGGQSVDEVLQSSVKTVTSPISNNRPNFNSPQIPSMGSFVVTNSQKYASDRGNNAPRSDQTLSTPQQARTRETVGRFADGNPAMTGSFASDSKSSWSNDPRPRSNDPRPRSNYGDGQGRFEGGNRANPSLSVEPKRPPGGGGYRFDSPYEKPNSAPQSGFSSHGGRGLPGRAGQGDFTDRTAGRRYEDNNSNNNDYNNNRGAMSSRGFSRGSRGTSNRGDRQGSYRNQEDGYNGNNPSRSQNYGDRDQQNRRYQDSDSSDRGNNYRGRGGRGQRGGDFGGRRADFPSGAPDGSRVSSDHKPSSNAGHFEAGDRFVSNNLSQETFDFAISHIESADEFYIQLYSNSAELTNLTNVLQKDFSQAPGLNFQTLRAEQACLARSVDGCWYRALVLQPGTAKVKVRFVDYGDTAEVDSARIRQLAKKHCAAAPYAYRCTLDNLQVPKNVNLSRLIAECTSSKFTGQLKSKDAQGRYSLESADLRETIIGTKPVEAKVEITRSRIKCQVVQIEAEQRRFYAQKDAATVAEIEELLQQEAEHAATLSSDELAKLPGDGMVIAHYEDAPYRAVVQSTASDDKVNVRFVDFGNSSQCLKTSLKACSEKLNSYPHQSIECQLHGVPSDQMDEAYKYLEQHSDSEELTIAVITERDGLNGVLLYDKDECINTQFGYDPSADETSDVAVTSAQEQPTTERQPTDEVPATTETAPAAPAHNAQAEEPATSSKHRQGLLTHVDQSRPYVYVQLTPESEDKMETIEALVDAIVAEDKRKSSYQVNDHVVAQYSEDENYYRACITAHSEASNTYTVHFLDYGNLDENVPVDHLYAYSEELDRIEPQAHGYALNGITSDAWDESIRGLAEAQINQTVEFEIIDEETSLVHMQFDNAVPQTAEPSVTITANVSAVGNDCFYIHIVPDGDQHVAEMDEHLSSCAKDHQEHWTANDLCIVSDNDGDKFYRARILSIEDQTYTVKCIDYGKTLAHVAAERLYTLPSEELYQRAPLAHQCRLYGVDGADQAQAIMAENIMVAQQVTLTMENKDDDDHCLFVTLSKESQGDTDPHDLCDDSKVAEHAAVTEESDTAKQDEPASTAAMELNAAQPDVHETEVNPTNASD